MKLLVIAPCLITPFYVYRGPKEKEYRVSKEIRKIISELDEDWQVLAYPCPEFILLKWPRPPMSREVMAHLGMEKIVKDIADFIGRVIAEENPEEVVFVGVKGSPTCGVFVTTSSDPEIYDYPSIRRFFYLGKEERIKGYREIIEKFGLKPSPGSGLLFEELLKRFGNLSNTYWIEIDKDNMKEGIESLRKVIRETREKPKN
ncbi:hypothetical protein A3L04_06150 [Thermococcus chitonophagus]|uniref:DUF523 domain-containing protein n=1 Tax=Thermococcus chitonophagus TaxID=54262 RepID=A0A170SF93_9EURY|nr:DUF523 domain-containing protein [Thermococcus chitonophagus]ASJ16681.1 hypothetical protein A3L04_06150 [Thermococcus chitonophagus]CUX77394.1 hypothetical protein CHITON_0615 [Thermococcus chitonophagus]